MAGDVFVQHNFLFEYWRLSKIVQNHRAQGGPYPNKFGEPMILDKNKPVQGHDRLKLQSDVSCLFSDRTLTSFRRTRPSKVIVWPSGIWITWATHLKKSFGGNTYQLKEILLSIIKFVSCKGSIVKSLSHGQIMLGGVSPGSS